MRKKIKRFQWNGGNKNSKNDRALGDDRVPNEFFKFATPKFLTVLLRLFNRIFDSGEVLFTFKTSIIFLLYNKGDRRILANYS